MTKKHWILAGVVLVLLLAGGGYWFYSATNDGALSPDAVHADDKAFGSPNAPVTMIEYFAQDCSYCSRFDQDVFPLLKAKYIDTGKVRYVMRFWPISALSVTAYKLDLCMPPDKFLFSVDLLFRNQSQWDSTEFPITDPHAGLIRMARVLGLTADQAEACMASTKDDAALNQTAQDGTTRYQVGSTPTFVIDFQPAQIPQLTWEQTQAVIDAALAAKGVK